MKRNKPITVQLGKLNQGRKISHSPRMNIVGHQKRASVYKDIAAFRGRPAKPLDRIISDMQVSRTESATTINLNEAPPPTTGESSIRSRD